MFAGQSAVDQRPSQSRERFPPSASNAPPPSVAPLNFRRATPNSRTASPGASQAPPSPRLPPSLEQHMISSGLQSALAPIPTVTSVSGALSYIQQPSYDPSRQIIWCRDVLFLVDRHQQLFHPKEKGPGPARIYNPDLQRLVNVALPLLMQLSSVEQQRQNPMPRHFPEALYLRATCEASGAHPQFVQRNPQLAFTHLEQAARVGFHAAWFRLGRDYEQFGDASHARECFENGAKTGVPSCLYRMGMAHLLGQLGLPADADAAVPQLYRAAKFATVDTPEPAYSFAMLLLDQFAEVSVPTAFFTKYLPAGSSAPQEARRLLERAAHFGYAPAQNELGNAFEYAADPFPFDALLSVQYYWLASQQGDVEAHMALSKWFLCGSEGDFEKDEPLAYELARKAARRGLPSAEFAVGYYKEIGVGCRKDLQSARKWYTMAARHGNGDAKERLQALSQPLPTSLSRQEHETITDSQLVRKRTLARERSRGTRHPSVPPVPEIPPTQGMMKRRDWSPHSRAVGPAAADVAPVRGYGASHQQTLSAGIPPVARPSAGPSAGYRFDGAADATRYNPHSPRPSQPSGDPKQRFEPLRMDNMPPARPPVRKSTPQTFEEMGFKSRKLQDKECTIM